MVRITAIKNPLEPLRDKQEFTMSNGLSIDEYLDAIYPPIPTVYSLAVLYNKLSIDVYNPPPVPDDCEIIFCAVPMGGGDTGKLIAKLVATVAITLISYGVGAWLAGKTMLALTAGGFASNAVIAGTMIVGTLAGAFLLNAILPTGVALTQQESLSESNTYSWDVASNKSNEGITLPVLYGYMKVTPVLISRNVLLSDDETKQYLRLIYALCNWTIDTRDTVRSLRNAQYSFVDPYNLYYNEQTGTGYLNLKVNDMEFGQYDDITSNFASGNNYQPELQGFEGTYYDNPANIHLPDNTEKIKDTKGDLIDKVWVVFNFPYGLYAISGTGTTETKVCIQIQYREEGETEWTSINSESEPEWDESDLELLKDIPEEEGDFWVAGYWADGNYAGTDYMTEAKFVYVDHDEPGSTSRSAVWKQIWGGGYISSNNCPVDGVYEHSYYFMDGILPFAQRFDDYNEENPQGEPRATAGYWLENSIEYEGLTSGVWFQLATDTMSHDEDSPYNTSDDTSDHKQGDLYTACNHTEHYGSSDKTTKCRWYFVEDGWIEYNTKATQHYIKYTMTGGGEVDYVTFKANSTSNCAKHYLIKCPGTTKVLNIKVKRVNPSDKYKEFTKLTDGRNKAFLYYLSEYTDITLRYPNVALLGVKILASEQLSGSIPTISCEIYKAVVNITKKGTTNPTKESDYNYKDARNPAWVCYDILHGCHIVNMDVNGTQPAGLIMSGTVKAEDIDYDSFEEWATFCDESFDTHPTDQSNPNRKVKPQFKCDIYFDSTVSVRKALDTVGLLGRGAVTQSGTMFTCTIERPEQTGVQKFIFNMANIEESSYSESWLPFDDRANTIEVKFWDRENSYEADIVTIITDQYEDDLTNTISEERKTSIDYVGCTDRTMASYFGKFLLNCNRYITLTASWTSFIDAIGCYPGQIIEVQNDVPQYGYGGRISKIYASDHIEIDQEFSFEISTTYEFVVYNQLNDDRHFYMFTVKSGLGLIDVLTTNELSASNFDFTPALNLSPAENYRDAKYNFGRLSSSSKLMRVLSISHAGDQKRKITAIEFVNQVYDGSLIITPLGPGDLPNVFRPPAMLQATCAAKWYLNEELKKFEPYVTIELEQDPDRDYINTYKIDYYEIYAHLVKGDCHTEKMKGEFEVKFNWPTQVFNYSAYGFEDYTIYTNCRVHNYLGYFSYFAATKAAYIQLKINASFKANVQVYQGMPGTFYGYTYDKTTYTLAIHWNPAGCYYNETYKMYEPILTWQHDETEDDGGNNYYTYSNYIVCYGVIDAKNDYPTADKLTFVETANIGNLYGIDGKLITIYKDEEKTIIDTVATREARDKIMRNSAIYGLTLPYQAKYVKIAVIARTKYNGLSDVNLLAEDYDIKWINVYVPAPYGDLSVTNTQIDDATLVVKQMPQTVYLTQMKWSYPLQTPYIDGFALIYRLQSYWWCWPVKKEIPAYKTGGTIPYTFDDIVSQESEFNFINFNELGGSDGLASISDQILSWIDSNSSINPTLERYPYPYFYMSFTDNENYEIMKVSLLPGSIGTTWRNVEQLPSVWFEWTVYEVYQGYNGVIIYPTVSAYTYKPGNKFVVILPGNTTWETNRIYEIVSITVQTNNNVLITFTEQIFETVWPVNTQLIIGDYTGINTIPSWPVGSIFSYLPNEFTDSVTYIEDTTQRSVLFGESVEIKMAIHATIVAFKVTSEPIRDDTPGYKRTNYVVWEVKLENT